LPSEKRVAGAWFFVIGHNFAEEKVGWEIMKVSQAVGQLCTQN